MASSARKSTRTSSRGTPASTQAAEELSGKSSARTRRLWKTYGRMSSIAAGVAATQASALVWRLATGKVPPATPENPDTTAREAAIWAVVSGSLRELARITATRKAVDYWIRSTGDLPPGMTRQSVDRVAEDQAASRPLAALRARVRAR